MKFHSIVEASHRMGNWLRGGDRRKSSYGPDTLRKTGSWGPKVDIFSSILAKEERKVAKTEMGDIIIGGKVIKATLVDTETGKETPWRPIKHEISNERAAEIDRRIREEYEKLDKEDLNDQRRSRLS